MKNLFFTVVILVLGINLEAQNTDKSVKTNYSLNAYGEVAVLIWDNQDITDGYGNLPLFGLGLEKKLSEDFKWGGGFDLGSSEEDGYILKYSQLKVYLAYAWYAFGADRPNIIGGFGGKRIAFEEKWNGGSESGNSLGFFLNIGVEIPVNEKTILGLGWNSTYSNMDYLDENVDVGSTDFYGKLILAF